VLAVEIPDFRQLKQPYPPHISYWNRIGRQNRWTRAQILAKDRHIVAEDSKEFLVEDHKSNDGGITLFLVKRLIKASWQLHPAFLGVFSVVIVRVG